jgi:hypothetical protein
MLTRFCQPDHARAPKSGDPVLTSSLLTGRALEKARLFYDEQVTPTGRIPLTTPAKRNSVRCHEVGQSDREQKTMSKGPALPALSHFSPPRAVHNPCRTPPAMCFHP